MNLSVFKVGDLYTSDEIQKSLAVGNAGGIRISLDGRRDVRRVVTMTSPPTTRQLAENPYHDRIEGDTLIYTGAGMEGDQSLAGPNRRLPEQLISCFPIYGFLLIASRRNKEVGPRRWRFLGLLRYLRHYLDKQADARGVVRQVWVFEFHIVSGRDVIPVVADQNITAEIFSSPVQRYETAEEERLVEGTNESLINQETHAAVEIVRRQLLVMDPRQFENLVKDVLVRSGFDQVTVTKYSQDGGIDVNAFASATMWPVYGLMLQVQAKRWLHTVGRKEVAELRGSLQAHSRGAIVTTSYYSKAAVREAGESGKTPIVLVDGHSFASLVRKFNIDERQLSLKK